MLHREGCTGTGYRRGRERGSHGTVPGKFVMHIYSFHSCTHSLSDFVPFMHPFTLSFDPYSIPFITTYTDPVTLKKRSVSSSSSDHAPPSSSYSMRNRMPSLMTDEEIALQLTLDDYDEQEDFRKDHQIELSTSNHTPQYNRYQDMPRRSITR